jgi:hypothetical protein
MTNGTNEKMRNLRDNAVATRWAVIDVGLFMRYL